MFLAPCIKKIIVAQLISTFLFNIAWATEKQFKAVVIGVSNYSTKLPGLGKAASDVKKKLERIALRNQDLIKPETFEPVGMAV